MKLTPKLPFTKWIAKMDAPDSQRPLNPKVRRSLAGRLQTAKYFGVGIIKTVVISSKIGS